MTDATLEAVEDALGRATDLEDEAAVDLLCAARRDVRALENDASVDEKRRRALENRVQQRLREVSEREAYDTDVGAATKPDEENAP
ncbi:hypothetical protein ACFOZ7_16480 [Natribaculum luteum]|uniref:Uncharacterized protein n=1 Tax=Natribaculum luteum TaxID=1586232 RepID=A0ABD5P2I8_9EURY|nr:hypothetical protein [Natribaculum luteum]